MIATEVRRIPALALLIVLISTAPSRGFAQLTGQATAKGSASKAPASERRSVRDTLPAAVQADFDMALELVDAGNYQAALFKFKQAYDTTKDPRLLHNVAACHAQMKQYVQARAALRRFKSEAAAAKLLTAEDVAKADASLGAYDSLIGRLLVQADQRGATVLVDGQDRGMTPPEGGALDLDMEEGLHEVVVTKDGFRDWSGQATVHGGGAETVLKPQLVRREGRLTISPSPAAAAVRVDGTLVGAGRVTSTLAPGPHHVLVTAEGRKAREFDVTVVDGQTRAFDVALDRQDRDSKVWWWAGGGLAAVAITAGVLAAVAASNQEPVLDTAPSSTGSHSLPLVRF